MARPISETTKFILSLPNLSAKEVIAKAKAKGLSTSENNVHRVRRLQGPSKAAKKNGASSTTAAPKPAANPAPSTPNKSDYVRSFAAGAAAKDIVAAGKAKGIKLDLQYVYKIRSRSKPASAPVPRAAAKPAARVGASSVEELFRAAAAELGLGRAVEILEGERARVRAVIGS
jgi:hypothetical protein